MVEHFFWMFPCAFSLFTKTWYIYYVVNISEKGFQLGEKLIKKFNRIFIGSQYSIDLQGYRTSRIRESRKMGYYVSDFLKKRNHHLKDHLSYEKES